jgi:hypothetical protein
MANLLIDIIHFYLIINKLIRILFGIVGGHKKSKIIQL